MNYMSKLIMPPVFALLLATSTGIAATYYVDYGAGNDANNGTSQATAWKRHPYMAGFAGRYSHAAGDRFVFRGGVTWPRVAFPLRIAAGGSADNNRDMYGVEQSWYAGAAWTRPVFDFEHTLIPGGWTSSAGICVDNVSFITFDNLEMIRHRAPLNNMPTMGDWGACTLALKGNVNNVTVQNCVIRDWSIPTPVVAPAHDGGGGGGVFKIESSGGQNIVITRCVFHQAGVPVRSGKALHLGATISFCEIYETSNAILGGGIIHDNHIYNIRGATDPAAHENAIYTFAPSIIYNNRVHHLDVHSSAIYVSPSFSGGTGYDLVYNNVVYAVGNQSPIQIDLEGLTPEKTGSRVYNNTLYHGSGYCIRVAVRGNAALGLLDCRNNHLITPGTAIGYNNPAGGCANVKSVTIAANVVQSPAQAAANGYAENNQLSPTTGGSPTVNNGLDLSNVFTTDLRGTIRPAGSWDTGAYEYPGATRANSSPVITPIQSSLADAMPADADLQVAEGSAVTLSASLSDADGDALTWKWIYRVGGQEVVHSNGSGTQASATYSYATGTGGAAYTWILQVSDSLTTIESSLTVAVLLGAGNSFDAESGLVQAPFAVSDGCISQPGQTVLVNGGRAAYSFTVVDGCDYTVVAMVDAPSEASNSFYVNMDSEPQDPSSVWHIPVTKGFEARPVSWQGEGTWDKPAFTPKYFTLTPGVHKLIVVGREAGVKLDRLTIVRTPAPPRNLRIASGD